ncbi:MAG: hypothetical protein C0625_08030 [Arcobacter sp.]|nr:MAG: hypothetical protein C0625_08030 [Arcobacter sp.]
MEKYTISIGNGFTIEANNNLSAEQQIERKTNTFFAEFELVEGKIQWIYNPLPMRKEEFQNTKAFYLFQEKAEFVVFILEDKEWKSTDTFEGTFIDAFAYIQERFKYE